MNEVGDGVAKGKMTWFYALLPKICISYNVLKVHIEILKV